MAKRCIGIELRSLNNLIMRYMENCCSNKKIDSITITNGWIIGYIAHNKDKDIFQKDLEKEFSITRSTASKVINLMVQKGLIERHSVSYDARLKKLVLTKTALDICNIMKSNGKKLEEKLTKGLSKEELDCFYICIQKMKHNLE